MGKKEAWNNRYEQKRFCIYACAGMLILFFCLMQTMAVRAESGRVYTCVISRCYSHPVTSVIEDAGGEASYATGQGMVESAVAATGLLEITDSGSYYLTVRMSMMDYTSGHSFLVQNVGDTEWMNTTVAATATGTDTNGSTTDFRIQVPSESCIVRCSMNVTPMGRDVIFYFYPGSYTEGNTSGMTAEAVTETSAAGGSSETAEKAQTGGSSETVENAQTGGSAGTAGNEQTGNSSGTAEKAQTGGSAGTAGNEQTEGSAGTAEKAQTGNSSGTAENEQTGNSGAAQNLQTGSGLGTVENEQTGNGGAVQKSQTTQMGSGSATAENEQTGNSGTGAESKSSSGGSTAKVKGLSLSTASGVSGTSAAGGNSDKSNADKTNVNAGITGGSLFWTITASVTLSGLILIAVAAAVVYYFRKNWKKWGGETDEE